MKKILTIEYETFDDLEVKVLSVIDQEKDEWVNQFEGDAAEELFNKLYEFNEENLQE